MAMPTHGTMKVRIRNGKTIVGTGYLDSNDSGQVWFDFSGKPYPSPLDWKFATTLTFKLAVGKERTWAASEVEYCFQSGWAGPRLVLQPAHRS